MALDGPIEVRMVDILPVYVFTLQLSRALEGLDVLRLSFANHASVSRIFVAP